MSASPDFKNELKEMLHHYLGHLSSAENKRNFQNEEFEVRFTPYKQPFFTKTDYDNVISRLMASDYSCKNPAGINMLRMQTEIPNRSSGAIVMSNIRTEICGSDIIQDYCKLKDNFNKLAELPENFNKIKFTMKSSAKRIDDKTEIKKITNADFNFNVSFNLETDYKLNSSATASIVKDWNSSKKTFRLINRIRFEHKTSPIAVDLSIIRNSYKSNGVMIPVYHIQDSGVFQNQDFCEVELEIINERVGPGKDFDHVDKLVNELQLAIKTVLCGLHTTKYPIPYNVQESVYAAYSKLVFGEAPRHSTGNREFIGPNSCTLQIKNIVETDNTNEPNIRQNYCVTEKADGERKLLYINKEGKIYLIDTNMRVQFTGCLVDPNLCGETVLDGEHIKFDRNKQYRNMFMAFDIYFLKKESVRDKDFMKSDGGELEVSDIQKYRFLMLSLIVEEINKTLRSFIKDARADLEVATKTFYFAGDIFKRCSELLTKMNDHLFPYETDGIIFTPINTGVGGTKSGQTCRLEKFTWPLSLKWKPPEFNTIDFLVTTKNDNHVQNAFEQGASASIRKYYTLVLMCGFNKKSKMIYNPLQDVFDDKIPSNDCFANDTDTYVPKPFLPSLPYDPNACFTNIYVDTVSECMTTESGEVFEKNMIVEFRYDPEREDGWRWIPLRVRHDKTYEFRNGNKNYGNSYYVANENWKSIHFPITKEMLCGSNIPSLSHSDEVYYNNTGSEKTSHTRGLRGFHNLYVKKRLITGVAKEGDTLIDYAVGKGGDIPKWKQCRLKFVFGIDYAIDNIVNQYDGVCARYLNERKQTPVLFDALFVSGNSGLNIRNGEAFTNTKERAVANAVFGNTKLNSELGKAVTKNHGIGKSGFNVSSCQFALHYFFENHSVLHNFLRNVSECTKVDGFFIGTCFDGATVFDKLKHLENYSVHVDDDLVFDVQKKYSQTGFVSDETSVGYAINVYQESINKYATEFLVNFNYLVRLMENYGFKLLTNEEAKHYGFPSGSGLFSELYAQMKMEGNPIEMSEKEKEISFLNRYFIFRKTHDVNAEKIAKKRDYAEVKEEEKEEEEKEEGTKHKDKKPKTFIKRLPNKVVLKN
jgi:mRNA (guanine-N7-)-methyltransferase